MPWTLVGTIVVPLNLRQMNAFPTVNLKKDRGFFFYLQANPLSTLIDFGYLLVIPRQTFNSLVCERPKVANWYPKGERFVFKVSTPDKFADPIPTTICLYPVRLFPKTFVPPTISVSLFIDQQAEETEVIVV